MVMINLKMSKDEADEQNGIATPSGSQYPYGTRLELDDETLDKLGMRDTLPAVGEEIEIRAKAVVTSVSQNATGEADDPSDKEQRVSLQLTDMDVMRDSAYATETGRMLYGAGGKS